MNSTNNDKAIVYKSPLLINSKIKYECYNNFLKCKNSEPNQPKFKKMNILTFFNYSYSTCTDIYTVF